jgi:hypothetical protein
MFYFLMFTFSNNSWNPELVRCSLAIRCHPWQQRTIVRRPGGELVAVFPGLY